jgi:membrane-associated protein
MNFILSTLLSYLLLYKYATIFVVVFAAAIIVPVPDSTMLVATGAFASQGYFSLSLALIVALVANILGDLVDYTLTYRWGFKIIKEHHIRKMPYFNKVEHFIRTNAGMAIFISRFVGTVGPLVNFLSGLANIPLSKFFFFDVVGNAVDIAGLLVAGYILGQYWQDFSGFVGLVGWIIVVAVVMYVIIKISRTTMNKKTTT